MNIIDQYISDNFAKPVEVIAAQLGIGKSYVAIRRNRLNKLNGGIWPNPSSPAKKAIAIEPKFGFKDEMVALINLITERKEGWAVEVAKTRLIELQKAM